jgi:hypothetical protein
VKPASVSFICAALQDYLPRETQRHSVCSCGVGGNRVMVTGVLDGNRIGTPVEVSYCGSCGLAPQARRDVNIIFTILHLPLV